MIHEIIQFNPNDGRFDAVFLGKNEHTNKYHVMFISMDGEEKQDRTYTKLASALYEVAAMLDNSLEYTVNG